MNGQENETMDLSEIIAMGYEAGLCDEEGADDNSIYIEDYLMRFAKLVAAKEREEIDQMVNDDSMLSDNDAIRLSRAIRARGEA